MERKRVVVDSLILEITRKCNACCGHCLRGNAEEVNVSRKVMRKLFEEIEYIHILTFSGGEPTLYVRAMREALNMCKELGVVVEYVYVVTNGVKYSKGLINVMNDWLVYCMSEQGLNPYSFKDVDLYLSEGIFGLSLSVDNYHPKMDFRCYEYKDLLYYNNTKEVKQYSTKYLIKEGRSETFMDARPLRDYELNYQFVESSFDGEDIMIPEMLYCNVYGEIFPCCDMSYKRQRNIAKEENNNILTRALSDIVYEHLDEQKVG